MKKIFLFILLIIPNTAMSYKTAQYKVIQIISEKIEVREYKNLTLATVTANEDSKNNNFRILFKFISGNNEQNQEIKMTTPVFQEKILNKRSMSFVMPDEFNHNNIPKPVNRNISIENLENVRFIAIRFSGRSSDDNFTKYQTILEETIKENNIKLYSDNPTKAYYNSPWTIPFLKRNEVLYQLSN